MLGNAAMPLRIVESTAACTYAPKRAYARRRARSPRHHARMNKKWLKRYGLQATPTAYIMGDMLVVHSILAPRYREAINRAFKPAHPGENWL